MLNVVMVQTNNYQGRGAEYANRLASQVRANLRAKHRIICITDDAASEYPRMKVKPADTRLSGWWEKIRLFKAGMFPEGERMLFLDLDTIVVRSLDFLLDYDGNFATLHDFWRPEGLGPAVMLWRSGWGADIWDEFVAEGMPMNDPRGDQWWIENRQQGRIRKEIDILQDLYPGKFVSYKTSCTQALPQEAHVVCFHGKPRPHEVSGWVKPYWS